MSSVEPGSCAIPHGSRAESRRTASQGHCNDAKRDCTSDGYAAIIRWPRRATQRRPSHISCISPGQRPTTFASPNASQRPKTSLTTLTLRRIANTLPNAPRPTPLHLTQTLRLHRQRQQHILSLLCTRPHAPRAASSTPSTPYAASPRYSHQSPHESPAPPHQRRYPSSRLATRSTSPTRPHTHSLRPQFHRLAFVSPSNTRRRTYSQFSRLVRLSTCVISA